MSKNEELDPEIADLLGVSESEEKEENLNLDESVFAGKLIKKTNLRSINLKKVFTEKHVYSKLIEETKEYGHRLHDFITKFSRAIEKDEKSMYRERLIPAYWNMLTSLIDKFFEDDKDVRGTSGKSFSIFNQGLYAKNRKGRLHKRKLEGHSF